MTLRRKEKGLKHSNDGMTKLESCYLNTRIKIKERKIVTQPLAGFPSFPQHYAGCAAATYTPCCMSGLHFEVCRGDLSNLEVIEANNESDFVFALV